MDGGPRRMIRDLQLSLLPDTDGRPVGPIPPSVFLCRTNAEMVAAVAPIYLSGSVLDVTYGRGKWWDRFTPEPFGHHDLKTDGVDFRCLPYPDHSWDTVVFDPPYVESGSVSTSSRPEFLENYGLGTDEVTGRTTARNVQDVVLPGLVEACRVARYFVLVKCMEYVASGTFHDTPTVIITTAAGQGWRVHDRIVHASGGGIGSGWRIKTVLRTVRAHSYLLVFAPVP